MLSVEDVLEEVLLTSSSLLNVSSGTSSISLSTSSLSSKTPSRPNFGLGGIISIPSHHMSSLHSKAPSSSLPGSKTKNIYKYRKKDLANYLPLATKRVNLSGNINSGGVSSMRLLYISNIAEIEASRVSFVQISWSLNLHPE